MTPKIINQKSKIKTINCYLTKRFNISHLFSNTVTKYIINTL